MAEDPIIKGYVTGLTPSEKAYLLRHPDHVSAIEVAADKALAEAQRRFRGPGLHNGDGDAFRHCYRSALLARDIGAGGARAFTTAHEGHSSNPAGEREMDLWNNAVGISIGSGAKAASDATLAAQCAAALSGGRPTTRPPGPGLPYRM